MTTCPLMSMRVKFLMLAIPSKEYPMPRVFITNEPLRLNRATNQWERAMDLSPASEHGELVFMLPPGPPINDYQVLTDQLTIALARYTENDLILPVGDMLASTIAVAIAVQVTGGPVRLLRWVGRQRCYAPVSVCLGGMDDHK